MTDEERFLKHVQKSGGCWTWMGARNFYGYGNVKKNKKFVAAHRLSWMIFNKKEIPYGMCVLHRCDNPSCVNPDHLFLGTHAENMADKKNKGRAPRGKINKPPEWAIEEIKTGKLSAHEYAKKFGIDPTTVRAYLRKRKDS